MMLFPAFRPIKLRALAITCEILFVFRAVGFFKSVGAGRVCFDQGCGLNRLETIRISRASAHQRTGRAGRERPGVCLRLWTEAEERGLRDAETPEIARLELSAPVLQLLAWGETDLDLFPWFEAPPATAVTRARELLHRLGALDDHGMTRMGQVSSGRRFRASTSTMSCPNLPKPSTATSDAFRSPRRKCCSSVFSAAMRNVSKNRISVAPLVRRTFLAGVLGQQRGFKSQPSQSSLLA